VNASDIFRSGQFLGGVVVSPVGSCTGVSGGKDPKIPTR
jgi:hypothetical protein